MTPPPIVEADCEMNCGYAEVRSGECECYNKEADAQDDRQPDWEKEWSDFGEVYDDEPNYI